MTPLHAIPIVVDRHLAGSKRAVRFGDGPIIVSPAMHELIANATPDELRQLLDNLPVLQLPPMPDPYGPLPMTTRPPAPPA